MRLGRYLLAEELGAGGMAVVYRAEDTALRRQVAVKVLYPNFSRKAEFVQRFLREARAAAALDHPNILRIFDVGQPGPAEDGGPGVPAFIVMELIRGRSLREFLEANGAPLAETVAMMGAVLAEALGAAHRAGVVHRDVKPANVMIAEGGRLVLCDFGVARVQDDALQTQSGAMLGTPAYMSPEQALGRGVDARSDLYSLGATLYHLATGVPPVEGTTAAVITAVLKGQVMSPQRRNPRIGADLARVLDRLMARDPAQRYQTADEASLALAAVAAPGGWQEPTVELRKYFSDPGGWNAVATPRILASSLARAREAAERRQYNQALSYADRILAFDPGNAEVNSLVARIGHGSRSWRRFAALAGTLGGCALAAVIAVAAVGVGTHGEVAVTGAGLVPAGQGGEARPDAGPVAAAAVVDAASPGRPVDAVPVVSDRPLDGSGRGRLPTREGDERRSRDAGPGSGQAAPPAATSVPDAAPAQAPAPAVAEAWLEVKIRPWCDISIDGVARGRSPSAGPIRLPPGRHQLVCGQGTGGGREIRRSLDLAPGERKTVDESLLSPVAVRVEVGRAARIDGRRYAREASASLLPGRHRVEVLDEAGTVMASGWVEVPVAPCALRGKPELACYE